MMLFDADNAKNYASIFYQCLAVSLFCQQDGARLQDRARTYTLLCKSDQRQVG